MWCFFAECSDSGFTNMPAERIILELEFFLSHGYLIMYSDFSLKALIKAWSEVGDDTAIGANPFVRTGSMAGSVTLKFNPFTLKTCISSQLQAVGELWPDQDFCTVKCLGSTVQYSLKPGVLQQKEQETRPYAVEVLTVAQLPRHANSVSLQVPDFSKLQKKKEEDEENIAVAATKLPMKTLWGDAGHVVLDYSKTNGGDGGDGEGDEGARRRVEWLDTAVYDALVRAGKAGDVCQR